MDSGASTPQPPGEQRPRLPGRTLTIVLLVQIALGAALLVWVALGRPLPGGSPVTTTAGAAAPERSTAAAKLAPRATTDEFDGSRAFKLLRRQVEHYGPRPAGSKASRRLASELRRLLPRGRFEAVPGGLRNVVGSLPGKGRPIVVGAHYDTEATVPGHVGANDGAAGTAAVVELARSLRKTDRGKDAPPIRFVLFDGEEEPPGSEGEDFIDVGMRGSKADVARHPKPRAMVLLDYVAEKHGMAFPRERNSDPELWKHLRAAARRVGTARIFPPGTTQPIIDDHWPYLRAGVAAIDIIDFDYPQRDSRADDMTAVSERSLDAVGETVFELFANWPRDL